MEPSWTGVGPVDSDPLAAGEFADGLTEDLRARVKGELEPGERLLWAARSAPPPVPLGAGFYSAGTIALILLAGGVMTIAYAMGDLRAHASRESPMPFGIIFCVAGCVMVLATIAAGINGRAERHRQTAVCYALTDRRAIGWTPEPRTDAVRIHSVLRGRIRDVERVERPDRSGNLDFSFSENSPHQHWSFAGFKHIPEVRRVEQIIRNNLIQDQRREV